MVRFPTAQRGNKAWVPEWGRGSETAHGATIFKGTKLSMEQKAQSRRLDKDGEKLASSHRQVSFQREIVKGQKMKARFSPRPEQRLRYGKNLTPSQ